MNDTDIKFYPPYKCHLRPDDVTYLSDMAILDLPARLEPVRPQPLSGRITINGEPTVSCDAIQIELSRDTFDRSMNGPPVDPQSTLAFNLVNNWLARLRVLSTAGHVKTIDGNNSIWRMQYLNDDGSPLEREPSLFRIKASGQFRVQVIPVTDELWNSVSALPWGYEPLAVDTLLLDAENAVDQIGPAIVLASTALETRAAYVLDRLAQLYGVSPAVWGWINDRGDYLKAPSVADQFDTLMSAVAQRSLKEDQQLWQAFKELRQARNSFVHHGQALIGGNPVDQQRTRNLLQKAREIVAWLDGLLPEAERRPVFRGPPTDVEFTRMISTPDSPVSDGTPDPPEDSTH